MAVKFDINELKIFVEVSQRCFIMGNLNSWLRRVTQVIPYWPTNFAIAKVQNSVF